MKVYIETFGCQMNERDSEAVAALLIGHGHEVISCQSGADITIVNTCSVRAKAEEKALGKLRVFAASKRAHPGRIVGAIGCMAQYARDDLFKKVKGLDFAIGPRLLSTLPAVIDAVQSSGGPVRDSFEHRIGPAGLCGHRIEGISSFVTVVEGCSRRCAYCVVPAARGPETSRPVAAILDEVRGLVAAGVREVTLLGQNVASYGRTSDVGFGSRASPLQLREPFPRLLESVSMVRDLLRARFTSNHPSGITNELITVMRGMPQICEHIHLPLQSGSDRLLAMMRRGYDVAEYCDAISRLKAAMPGLAITTDIIVGFPTETESDFNATRALMEQIRFDNSYIFKYSPRPNTIAAGWQDDVPQHVKALRNRILLEDQDRIGSSINRKLIGQDVEVLVEGRSLRNSSRWTGRSRTNKIVIIEASEDISGPCTALIRVDRGMPQTLHGKLVRRLATHKI